MATKLGAELTIGDVVHYNSHTSWKLTERTAESDKTVSYAMVFVKCDLTPSMVGKPAHWRFRKATKLTVN